MAENHSSSVMERWKAFHPSKTMWFWSSVGIVLATIIVGFGWGGWVGGGTAKEMAEEAATEARAQLVAGVCVQRFVNSDGFVDRLTKLKKADSWDREDLIKKGEWASLPGMEEPVENAADLCASDLADMSVPTRPESGVSDSGNDVDIAG